LIWYYVNVEFVLLLVIIK